MVEPVQSAAPPMRHSIDFKANGEISRMRNHKGNMPSLPQTKYCSLCPAKFTRTTHLNRHLRSHTNERLHRCNTCQAEFTRSDLLTRHKRTCGDARNANKSRRKSCQACAESKVKCNLQYPCSKCSSRGRDCIFINDPEASRNKRNAAKKTSQTSTPKPSTTTNSSNSTSPIHNMHMHSSYPSLYSGSDITPSPTLSMNKQLVPLPPLDLPGFCSSSSEASSRSSPRSDLYEPRGDFAQSFEVTTFDTLTLDNQVGRLFPQSPFDNFSLDHTISPCSPPSAPGHDLSNWMEGTELFPRLGGGDIFPYSPGMRLDGQNSFMTDYASLPSASSLSAPTSQLGPTPNPTGASFDSSALTNTIDPSAEDLEHYLYLFFSAFSTQIPLIHPSTWKTDGKPAILIRAMQACGALFVKTSTAMNFINNTLVVTRDSLILEFSNNVSDLSQQINLVLAVVLLQTIGLFHQRPDQRVSSNVYHGMLVMMIRRIGLLSRVASWALPDLNNIGALDNAWRDWAQHETVKRALLLSYLHDCCHCMYFSMPPSFNPNEFNINLPCDDGLWTASSAAQWLQSIKSPSPYGLGLTRISGFGMQRALAILSDTQPSAVTPTLNPFSHFILIHTILRNLYASSARSTSENSSINTPSADNALKDSAFSIQYALHNWYQMWMSSPEATRYENNRIEPPFIYNALPFYWLGQVSLMALQDDANLDGDRKNEGRYRLMKEWLDRIKSHLRNGTQIPTQLWEELMKIRHGLQLRPNQSNSEGGLTAFFPTG